MNQDKINKLLAWASRNGVVEVVKLLLETGANVHANDDYALIWASKNDHLEVVKVLKKYMNKDSLNANL